MKHPGATDNENGLLPPFASINRDSINRDGGQSSLLPAIRGMTALRLLLEAYDCAKELRRNVWDFAVEIEELQNVGCTSSEFRWLVCKEIVAHAREIPPANGEQRAFEPCRGLVFNRNTCFALTEAGVQLARSIVGRQLAVAPRVNGIPTRSTPTWDHDLQELRVGKVIVKQFKVPAENQERILSAFEEEEWPVRIDDPLPPRSNQLPKRRLHDTINSLNRNQKQSLIRFLGDGRGEGVRWHLVQRNGSAAAGQGNGNRSRGSLA